jgi:hypothetical protein
MRFDILVNGWVLRVLQGEEVDALGGLKAASMCHVQDLAEYIIRAISLDPRDSSGQLSLDLGDIGPVVTPQALSKKVLEAAPGARFRFPNLDHPLPLASSSKSGPIIIGYTPQWRLERGTEEVKHAVQTYLANGVMLDRQRFLNQTVSTSVKLRAFEMTRAGYKGPYLWYGHKRNYYV